MKTASEIIDAEQQRRGLPVPTPAHASLGPDFVRACIVAAVAERDAEWKQQSIQTPQGAREQSR